MQLQLLLAGHVKLRIQALIYTSGITELSF